MAAMVGRRKFSETLPPELVMPSRLQLRAAASLALILVAGCDRKPADAPAADASASVSEAVDTAAAAAAIRKLDEAFLAAANAGDAAAAAALYAPDAISNPENSPPLVGRDAILKYNQEFFKLPKLHMSGGSELIRFSDDGTMAYEQGNYALSFEDPKGHTIKDQGKFLNVVRQVDGKWLVVIDAFSSNNPPPK
jgi:uncharacterized protein (TIGR02246 family)